MASALLWLQITKRLDNVAFTIFYFFCLDDIYSAQDTKLQTKYGFSFGDGKSGPSNTANQSKQPEDSKPQNRMSADASTRGHSNHTHPRRHER